MKIIMTLRLIETKKKLPSKLTLYKAYEMRIIDKIPTIIDTMYTHNGVEFTTYLEIIVNG